MRKIILCLWGSLGLSLGLESCDHVYAVDSVESVEPLEKEVKSFFSFFTRGIFSVPQEDCSELKRFCGQRILLRSFLNCGEKAIRQISADKSEKTCLKGYLLASFLQSFQVAMIQSLTDSIKYRKIVSFTKYGASTFLSFASSAAVLFLCKSSRSLREGQAAFSLMESLVPFVQWSAGSLGRSDVHLSWKGVASVFGDFVVSLVTQYFEQDARKSRKDEGLSETEQSGSLFAITASSVFSLLAKRQFLSLSSFIRESFLGGQTILGDKRTKGINFQRFFGLEMAAYLGVILGIEWWKKNENNAPLNRQVCKNISSYWVQELNKYLNLVRKGLTIYDDIPFPEILEILAVPSHKKMVLGLGGLLLPLFVDVFKSHAVVNQLNKNYAEILSPFLLHLNIIDGAIDVTMKKVKLGYTARQEFLDVFAVFWLKVFEEELVVLQDMKERVFQYVTRSLVRIKNWFLS